VGVSIFQDDSLKQAWAEGYNVLALDPAQAPTTWLDQPISLPLRVPVPYPFQPFPVGFIKVKRRFSLDVMYPRVRGLWAGALEALCGPGSIEEVSRFNAIVHWPFLVTTLTPSWIVGQTGPHAALEPDTVLQEWLAHASQIQETSAEQYLLELRRRPRWHPYREATGAMRRAPLWGVLNAPIPAQAGALAYHDAVVAHAEWGTWTAYLIAQVAAQLCQSRDGQSLSAVFTKTLEQVAGYKGAQPAAIELLADVRTACAKAHTWEDRIRLILEPFAGYPTGHSLPNFAIILAAVLSFPNDPEPTAINDSGNTAIAAICEAGWDAIGNSVVFGALQGIHHPPESLTTAPAFVEECINHTIALLPKTPSFLRP